MEMIILYTILFTLAFIFLLYKRWNMKKVKVLTAREAYALSQQHGYHFIDCRTDEEVKQGTILSTKYQIDAFSPTITSQLNALDRQQKYILFCAQGHRSLTVYHRMLKAGFLECYQLQGGIKAWKFQHLPLEQKRF